MNFVAVAIVLVIVLGHPFNKESSFDWFKSHSPLFKSQQPDHQVSQTCPSMGRTTCFKSDKEHCLKQLLWRLPHIRILVLYITCVFATLFVGLIPTFG